MSIKTIKQKLNMAEKTIDKVDKYFIDLRRCLKKYYRGEIDFFVTMVDGDGIVLGYDTSDSSCPVVVPIDSIINIIDGNGFFDDEDLENNSI